MNYTTYWSIANAPSHSINASTIALVMTLLGAIVLLITKKFKWIKSAEDISFIIWASGIFTFIGLLMFIQTKFIYPTDSKTEATKFLESPGLGKVEGVISQFSRSYREAKFQDETIERFAIDTIRFAYGDAPLGKFNSFTKTNNSVIFNGQKARIIYSHGSPYGEEFNTILKIEIAKQE